MPAIPLPPADTQQTEQHVLRKDLLNVVSEPPAGAREIFVTIDADGGLRFWLE